MSQTVVDAEIWLPHAVAREACRGLFAVPKALAPWLFYDDAGCALFEQITRLPEYYLTRTERNILRTHAEEMVTEAACGSRLTVVELGAGTASKTGIVLEAVLRCQPHLRYQPVDVAASALEEARVALEGSLPGLTVVPQVANYTVELMHLHRDPGERVLAMYIGSSIGNFTPEEASQVLCRLRERLQVGDSLLLGTDMAPCASKPVRRLLAAYDDAAGVTAAFNVNVLTRLNRELGMNFDTSAFSHVVRWNEGDSRIEMHLQSLKEQRVRMPGLGEVRFRLGETVHTENSYKFSEPGIKSLLAGAQFEVERKWEDADALFGVTLARAI